MDGRKRLLIKKSRKNGIAMMGTGVFQFIATTIDLSTAKYVTAVAARLMLDLQQMIVSGVTHYIVFTTYALMTGAIQSPLWTIGLLQRNG